MREQPEEVVSLKEFAELIALIQEDLLPIRTTSAVGVVKDKKHSMIEADQFRYKLMDMLVDFDSIFRKSVEMQKLAVRVRKAALRERREEELSQEEKEKVARRKHLVKKYAGKQYYP